MNSTTQLQLQRHHSDSLAGALKHAETLISQAIDKACEEIEAIAAQMQNPAVTRLSGSAFEISSKSLGQSWDPFAHDWGMQFQMVARLLRLRNLGMVRSLLEGARVDDKALGRVCLSAPVIEACRLSIGDI
ncbi:hypothetical protein [Hydrogenophaga sp. 2FB]|uniref:hypothetical protein n=1 Tax=Hydrogenophaga sp. 2FB TaxID=2502187 RepID=UPI0010FA4AD5|nr:hypothetical protein [Hydrogenophaga sp. 2FB]